MVTVRTRGPFEAVRRARRAELFAEAVDQALGRDEVVDGLAAAPGIDADYLRTRCKLNETELWADVADVATKFDEAANEYERMQARPPFVAGLHAILTFPSVQRKAALAGLGLCAVAFFLHSPGREGATPHFFLLLVASVLAGLGIFDFVFASLVKRVTNKRHPTPQERLWSEVILSSLATCLFMAAVISVITPSAFNGARSPGSTSGWLLILPLLVGALFALPFLRFSLLPDRGPMRLRVNVFWPLTVVVGTCLPLVGALARNSDGSKMVTTAIPDLTFLFSGFTLIGLAALLAGFGIAAQPAAVVSTAFAEARLEAESRLTDDAVLPLLRTEINNKSQSYDVRIRVDDASGLGELSDPMYKVRTTASDQVASLLKYMPGGSVGLAGARGCGKTTLMESYCGAKRSDVSALAVMVSAPVEYSPREFLLHLYAKVCREALGPDGETPLGLDPLTRLHRRRHILVLSLGALTLSAVGVFLLIAPGLGLVIATPQLWGLAVLLLALLLVLQLSRTAGVPQRNRDTPASLRTMAAERLEEIRFQQAFTATWTGSIKTPVGLESALGGGRSLTRQQMHLPEIVDSLRDFLENAAGERRVLIGVDELDKMRSERAAEQFLNDIKGIFGVRGCYYLVSVSEDAMVGFERRGMPFRDVFDSTFDEIVWFGPLAVTEAIAAIDRRVLGMPVPFKQLCHALAGGLPRDLIRVTRAVLNAQHRDENPTSGHIRVLSTGLSTVVHTLVTDDVIRKTRAVAVAAHRIEWEPDVSRFLVVCERMANVEVNSTALHIRITEIARTETSRLHRDSTSEPAVALLRLMSELACYYYYAATICDFFDSDAPSSRWDLAKGGADDVVADLNLLAKARQAFALNTRVAWEVVSTFRKAWGLTVEPFPTSLEID